MKTVLKKTQLLQAYMTMRLIRAFEDHVHDDFATGAVPGFVHLYAGQEASATGVCFDLGKSDHVISTHRGHGHCIAKGMSPEAMMAEIYGKATGICKGKGGSMHLADLSLGIMGANGIVGAGGPLICGAGLAKKLSADGSVAVCFFGDGASNQGAIMESMNLAAIWKLPVIFVAENNGYAEATAATWSMAIENVADRAPAFGMPGVIVDGFDFFAIRAAAHDAIQRARRGDGPTLLETKLTRYYGHFEGDAQTYRAPGEVKRLKETKDCLRHFAREVTDAGLMTADELASVDHKVVEQINAAVAKAKSDPVPQESELYSDVYSSYP